MVRTDSAREDLLRMVRRSPFSPFAVVLESGDRAIVAHPENIAFDPEPKGRQRVVILADNLVHHTTLSAVSSVAMIDQGEPSGD